LAEDFEVSENTQGKVARWSGFLRAQVTKQSWKGMEPRVDLRAATAKVPWEMEQEEQTASSQIPDRTF
jgi:hypothetical protein